jgi:MSHA biogenesis protein MshK
MKKSCLCLYTMLGYILLWSQSFYAQYLAPPALQETQAERVDSHVEPAKMRDPTQPAIVDSITPDLKEKKKEDIYTLQSIIVSPTRRIALINDQFVSIGDWIGQEKVELIENNKVVLSRQGQKKTLYLFDLQTLE